VAEVTDLPEFLQRVAGAEFGRLGDGHDTRPGPVVVAAATELFGDQFWRDLAVGRGDLEELGAEHSFCRAALVGVDVRRVGADHGLVPAQHQAQPDHVGSAAVQHQEDVTRRAELPA
jgi:hypothetical protein